MMVRTNFKEVPETDRKYLAWVRTLPCVICGGKSQAHHQQNKGDGRMGGTCSDKRALPLCFAHHRGGGTDRHPGCFHGPAKAGGATGWDFWKAYGVDVEAWIVRLNGVWRKLQEMKHGKAGEVDKEKRVAGSGGLSGESAAPAPVMGALCPGREGGAARGVDSGASAGVRRLT